MKYVETITWTSTVTPCLDLLRLEDANKSVSCTELASMLAVQPVKTDTESEPKAVLKFLAVLNFCESFQF
jgi:hypothetical protein